MHALRELRQRRNLSQPAFAALIGWSAASLRLAERGIGVGERMVCVLAEKLKLSVPDAKRLADGEPVELAADVLEALGGAKNGTSGLRDAVGVSPARAEEQEAS